MMNGDEAFDELAWEADRRDFVADWRDGIASGRDMDADVREVIADEREQRADDREADLDELHRRLDARAVELGLPALTPAERERTAARYARAAIERNEARGAPAAQRRSRPSGNRTSRGGDRREAVTPTTRLAVAFAEIARHLYQADDVDDVLTRIVFVAVSAVQGCDMASVTVRDDGGHRTVASTHAAATESDHAQYETGEGPCLDAVDEPRSCTRRCSPTGAGRRSAPARPNPASSRRSPTVSPRRAAVPAGSLAGSLNAYAGTPDAFDAEAQEIGLILAAHATLAAGSILEREPSRT